MFSYFTIFFLSFILSFLYLIWNLSQSSCSSILLHSCVSFALLGSYIVCEIVRIYPLIRFLVLSYPFFIVWRNWISSVGFFLCSILWNILVLIPIFIKFIQFNTCRKLMIRWFFWKWWFIELEIVLNQNLRKMNWFRISKIDMKSIRNNKNNHSQISDSSTLEIGIETKEDHHTLRCTIDRSEKIHFYLLRSTDLSKKRDW